LGFVPLTDCAPLVMALVAVLTLLSVGLYLAEWVRHMNTAASGP